MKMKNIIAVLASGALLFAGCTKEYEVTTLDVIQLSKTFISVPEDGTHVTVELTASVDWSFDKLFEHEIEGQYEDHEVAKEMKETPDGFCFGTCNRQTAGYSNIKAFTPIFS